MNRFTVLITQPDFDKTTRYVSAWSEEVEEFVNSRGHKIILLQGKRANRNEFESIVCKTGPQLIMFNGHGNDNQIGGQEEDVLLDEDSNEIIIKGRIIYALSCSAARSLGRICVNKGTIAFIGYSGDYIFLHHYPKISRPREDNRAKLFFKPSNLIPISLIKGNTAGDSYKSSKDLLRRNMLDLLNSETYNEDRICLPYLMWNYQNLALLGDEEARL